MPEVDCADRTRDISTHHSDEFREISLEAGFTGHCTAVSNVCREQQHTGAQQQPRSSREHAVTIENKNQS